MSHVPRCQLALHPPGAKWGRRPKCNSPPSSGTLGAPKTAQVSSLSALLHISPATPPHLHFHQTPIQRICVVSSSMHSIGTTNGRNESRLAVVALSLLLIVSTVSYPLAQESSSSTSTNRLSIDSNATAMPLQPFCADSTRL